MNEICGFKVFILTIEKGIFMKKKIVFVFCFCIISFAAYTQTLGRIVDAQTRLPVSFATVSYKVGIDTRGVIADVQGNFSIPHQEIQHITVSSLGYNPKQIADISKQKPLIIELEENFLLLGEIVITPGNNPAIRIIKKVLENKNINNFENYSDYSYRCYLKTVWGTMSKFGDFETDTTLQKTLKELLISETVSLSVKSKGQTGDEIIAMRTSGMDSPLYGQMNYIIFHKAISFYNNYIRIFSENETNDKIHNNYTSPLHTGCLSIYNYQLENEYTIEGDTIFEISYFPKWSNKLNGLKGTLFIHSNNYAIANIVAEPYEKTMIDFKYKQEYEMVGDKWFPKKLESGIMLSQLNFGRKSEPNCVTFLTTSVLDSITIDKSNNTIKYLDEIRLNEESISNNSDIILDNVRPIPFTIEENKSFTKIDSTFREINFDKIANYIPKLTEGKILMGKFDIDALRIYNYSDYEGARWGFGMHTNEYLMKYLSVGGYVGYGVSDKKIKYGGEVEYTLNPSRSAKIKYDYQNTLKEVGGNMDFNLFDKYGKNFVASKFEYIIKNKLEGDFHITRPLKMKVSLSTKDITPAYAYSYKGSPLLNYGADELKLSLRYAVGEKHTMLGIYRTVTSVGNPIFTFDYTRGLGFRKESFTYNKVEVAADFVAYNRLFGQTDLRIEGGYIDSNLPYGLLFSGDGSKGEHFSFILKNTFQTMRPDEFLSDKYANLFFTQNFGAFLFKSKYFRPEFSLAYNIGLGDLRNASNHEIDFNVKKHPYQEAGLIIDNIIRIPVFNILYLRLGIGGFLRHGHYEYDKFEDNISLKTSLKFFFK